MAQVILDKPILSRNGKAFKEDSISISDVRNLARQSGDMKVFANQIEKLIEEAGSITMKRIYEDAVLYRDPEKKNENVEHWMRRYDIWKKINSACGSVDLNREEMNIIRDALAKMGTDTLVLGQVVENLEDAIVREKENK